MKKVVELPKEGIDMDKIINSCKEIKSVDR